MIKNIKLKIKNFEILNKVSKKGGIVFFGSSYFAKMNVSELAENSGIGIPVYNRSFENLTIDRIDSHLTSCIYELQPCRIFVNIGETDAADGKMAVHDFINKYECLILDMHRHCKGCRIFIVSIPADNEYVREVNAHLSKFAKETGCDFIDISKTVTDSGEYSTVKVFNMIKPYMRQFPVNFADAMQYMAV